MTELEQRLQKKAEEDRKRAEAIFVAEIETLSGNLRRLTVLFIALGVGVCLVTLLANLAVDWWFGFAGVGR